MPFAIAIENTSCIEVDLTINNKDLAATCLWAAYIAILLSFDRLVCRVVLGTDMDEIVTVKVPS